MVPNVSGTIVTTGNLTNATGEALSTEGDSLAFAIVFGGQNMASAFKNAGITVPTTDNSSANLYTSGTSGGGVIHALYVTNKSSTNTANVDVKVTTDGGSTFKYLAKSVSIAQGDTLMMDKPINLETSDIIRVVAEVSLDSSAPDVEAFASILEVS